MVAVALVIPGARGAEAPQIWNVETRQTVSAERPVKIVARFGAHTGTWA
jgi:hypothetical protein